MNSHLDRQDLRLPQLQNSTASASAVIRSEGDFYVEEVDSDSDPAHSEIEIQANRKSIDFQYAQYGRYMRKVQESGFDPKKLLTGLEIVETGSNAPPASFWRLITIRDRLIIECNGLIERIRHKRKEKIDNFKLLAPIVATIAAGLQLDLVPIHRINLVNIPTFSYLLLKATQIALHWHDERQLRSITRDAINWELVKQSSTCHKRSWW